MSRASTSKGIDVVVAGRDCAFVTHHQIVLAYFTGSVTIDSLRALHEAHMAMRVGHPSGTVTLSIVASATRIPDAHVRRYAASIGRQASVGLLGEGIVLEGHPFWVAMARSALRAIQLLAHGMHSHSIFHDPTDGIRWALERAGRPQSELPEILGRFDALVAALSSTDDVRTSEPASAR